MNDTERKKYATARTMYEIQRLEVAIEGGSIPLVSKIEGDERTSAFVLIRGGAGTGKTIFAMQLALHMAAHRPRAHDARPNDVIYVGIEQLPGELRAQLGRFLPFKTVQVISPVDKFSRVDDRQLEPYVFATIDDPNGDFGETVASSIDITRGMGMTPWAIVVDGVSPDISRDIADGAGKFAAENGVVLIVVEEIGESRKSPWFAADVVFELRHDLAFTSRRSMIVRKNRYGKSDLGPHKIAITTHGFSIEPSSPSNPSVPLV